PVRLAVAEAAPRVEYEDRFGNLVTNVAAAALAGIRAVAIAGVEVPLVGTYADVVPGAPLALVGSFGRLEVAVRDGSAARTLGAGRGAALELLR
ncbi:MAG: SAM-dependent chlorinase/fluorinase, partial [Planctomycetes bacterium]|nr:SAM-dependent chlorinase/fluorinase [Planctomycetota bacterium]